MVPKAVIAARTNGEPNQVVHQCPNSQPHDGWGLPRILRRAWCLLVFSTKNSVPYRTPDYCGHVHAHVLRAQSLSKNSGCAGGREAPRFELAGASPNGPCVRRAKRSTRPKQLPTDPKKNQLGA